MMDEAQFVEKAKAGSSEAFAELVRLHQARVRAFLSRYVHDEYIADDLAQEVFLNAYRGLSAYRPEAPFGAWLIVIARNQALSYLRGEDRRRERELAGADAALARWRLERLQAQNWSGSHEDQRISALGDCLKRLPPHSAALLDQHYSGGLGAAEIARAAGKPEGVVRMTLLRIRQSLRQCVQQRLATQTR